MPTALACVFQVPLSFWIWRLGLGGLSLCPGHLSKAREFCFWTFSSKAIISASPKNIFINAIINEGVQLQDPVFISSSIIPQNADPSPWYIFTALECFSALPPSSLKSRLLVPPQPEPIIWPCLGTQSLSTSQMVLAYYCTLILSLSSQLTRPVACMTLLMAVTYFILNTFSAGLLISTSSPLRTLGPVFPFQLVETPPPSRCAVKERVIENLWAENTAPQFQDLGSQQRLKKKKKKQDTKHSNLTYQKIKQWRCTLNGKLHFLLYLFPQICVCNI